MKIQQQGLQALCAEELQQINGGGDQSSASMSLSSGAGSLLSLEFDWQQGDHSRHYRLDVGKDIDFDMQLKKG